MDKLRAIVSDANVLIDIIKADVEMLEIAAEHYKIHVPYLVLQEVKQLDEDSAGKLGLILYEESIEMINLAQKQQGKLSPEDIVCFEIARKEGFICLTNDKNLKAKCDAEGVECMRGLRLIINLVKAKKISVVRAKSTGEKIRKSNVFIQKDVFDKFLNELDGL